MKISATYTINEEHYYILHGTLNGESVVVGADGTDIRQLMDDGFVLRSLEEYDDIETYKTMRAVAFSIAKDGC